MSCFPYNSVKTKTYRDFILWYRHTHIYIQPYIYIYILLSSCANCIESPDSLTIHPYHQSLLASLLVCILCPYKAAISLCQLANTGTSIREQWICPCFSRNASHILFILLKWFVRWEACGRTAADFLTLRVFRLLSSSLLLFPQCFSRYVLWPSSGVCRTREPSRNFELCPLLNPQGSPVLIPLAITGNKC